MITDNLKGSEDDILTRWEDLDITELLDIVRDLDDQLTEAKEEIKKLEEEIRELN